MDARQTDRHLTDPAWRRWTLLAALLAIGSTYIAAYAFFIDHSVDFIVAQHNQKALDFSRSHTIALPAKLSFGANTDNAFRLGGGWNRPDTNGVWSATKDAWIELVVLHHNADLLLRLDTIAFISKGESRISASVNGVALGTWIRTAANASAPIEIRVPRRLANSGELAVHLQTDTVASPFRLHRGKDTRQLGVLLTSLQISDTGTVPAGMDQ